jgi:hypothetical protein
MLTCHENGNYFTEDFAEAEFGKRGMRQITVSGSGFVPDRDKTKKIEIKGFKYTR